MFCSRSRSDVRYAAKDVAEIKYTQNGEPFVFRFNLRTGRILADGKA